MIERTPNRDNTGTGGSLSEAADAGRPMLADAVQANSELLQQLLEQVSDLRDAVLSTSLDAGDTSPRGDSSTVTASTATESTATESTATESTATEYSGGTEPIQRLRDRVMDYEREIGELKRQNCDLASRVASSNVRSTLSDASGGCDEALTWDERKERILRQLEEDAVDEGDQVNGPAGHGQANDGIGDPTDARDVELAKRNEELRELRGLLKHQSGMHSGGIVQGAAPLAEMLDADEFIQKERQRLSLLQEEWEEKFRQGEIEASLERAKLSRERQELAHKQLELEERLTHVRREFYEAKEDGADASPRWLVKLGLSDHDA